MSGSIPDPTGLGLMLGLAHASKDTITDVIRRLFGKTLDKAGDAIADYFFAERAGRAMTVATSSLEMLKQAKTEPQAVPPKLWVQILEQASWEEEPELQSKWASLLANAASPGEAGKILPAFADILRLLTPVHARILDWMFAQEEKADIPDWFSTWPNFERKDIESKFSLSPADYALLINDMERMQLLEPYREVKSTPDDINGEELLNWILIQLNNREKYRFVAFTALGLRFMHACTPPKSSTVA